MDAAAPLLIGCLFAAGVYNVLGRSLVQVLIGFSLMGHAANLLVFSSGGLSSEVPPIIPPGGGPPPEGFQDPLPQALVLTAIVIGFGLTGFFTALIVRTQRKQGSEDVDALGGETP